MSAANSGPAKPQAGAGPQGAANSQAGASAQTGAGPQTGAVPAPDGPSTGPQSDPSPTTPQSDRSIGELVGQLTTDVSTLFRQEVELAKAELKQEASRAGKASGMLVAGGVVAFVAFLLVSWAIAWALDVVLPTWLAFLIVAVVYGVIAGVLITSGRKKLQQVNVTPEQTVETLKEDKEWLKNRK